MTDKKLEVSAIENGTVIDHIPADCLFKIVAILGLANQTNRMTIGNNLESRRMGRKAIIKIADRYCRQEEINRIAIIAPAARVNIIRNFEVVEKLDVALPESVEGFVRCANPRCVTNNQPVTTRFDVLRGGGGAVELRCLYCEKITSHIELVPSI